MNPFEEAQKARAYIQTTAQHGPSQQLLDFINYDGNLFSDLGLESLGLETMSLTTQHEMLVSKLNPDHLEEMAVEGLGSTIMALSTKLLSSDVAIPLLVGAVAITRFILSNRDKTLVISHDEYLKLKTQNEKLFNSIKSHIEKIPTNHNKDNWEKYSNDCVNLSKRLPDDFLSSPTLIKKSGWNDSTLKSEVLDCDKDAKKFTELEKDLGNRLKNLSKLVESDDFKEDRLIGKYILEVVNSYKKMMSNLKDHLRWRQDKLKSLK
jgi:hypothetical protein